MPEPRTPGRPTARSDERELIDRLPPDIAERAAARIERETDATATLGDPRDQVRALGNEQVHDGEDTMGALSVGVVTGSQARGALFWGAVGLVIGASVGALIGLIPMADLNVGTRVIIWAIVGAFVGATPGFVFGGGRQPEIEGEVRDATSELSITVHPTDEKARAAADRVLDEADLEAADRARKVAKQGDHEAFHRL